MTGNHTAVRQATYRNADEGARQLLDAVPVLPTQMPARNDGRMASPSARLAAAVLEGALHELHHYRSIDSRTGRALYQDARDWLLAEDEGGGWPYSCANLCAQLGIDVEALRKRIREGYTPPAINRRHRPNFSGVAGMGRSKVRPMKPPAPGRYMGRV